MKGITWTQVAQYWVLITAFLIPAIAISIKLTGTLMPQAGLGAMLTGENISLLAKLDGIQKELGFGPYTEPFVGKWDRVNVFFVALALMVGTAGLPHVIVRFYTVRSPKAARWSGFWALFFIAGLYLTAPAVAGFARYYMLETLNGTTQENLPGWFKSWEKTGLILWYDDGDGRLRYSNDAGNEIFRAGSLSPSDLSRIAREHQQWLDSDGLAGKDGREVLSGMGLSGPDRDIIVLATPEMAELSNWIIAFVAAGGLAAALSTASGLLLVISSSVAHDLYYKVLNPGATEAKRLLVGRATIGVAVIIAGVFGIYPPAFVGQVVAFAFGLAAASFFPAIVLGIFWKRVSMVPAVAGMLCGIGLTGFYIVQVVFFGMDQWTFGLTDQGIDPQGIGTVGMLLNFAVTIILTPFFPAPPKRIQELVDKVREPEGWSPAVDIDAGPEH
jgi:cation/acetate symporter